MPYVYRVVAAVAMRFFLASLFEGQPHPSKMETGGTIASMERYPLQDKKHHIDSDPATRQATNGKQPARNLHGIQMHKRHKGLKIITNVDRMLIDPMLNNPSLFGG